MTSYCPDGLEATELLLTSNPRLRVFYDLDTPVTLECLSTGRPLSYIGPRGLADFDLVLSYTGGIALQISAPPAGIDPMEYGSFEEAMADLTIAGRPVELVVRGSSARGCAA